MTCHTSSTAAGVTIATLSGIVAPFSVIATAIGVTAPPVGKEVRNGKMLYDGAGLFTLCIPCAEEFEQWVHMKKGRED